MLGRNRSEGVVALAFSTIKGSPVFLIIMLTSLVWGFAFSGLETFWQPRVFHITGGMGSTFIYGLLTNGYFLAGALIGGILAEVRGIGFTWKVGAGLLMISSISYLLVSKKKKIVTEVSNELQCNR